MFIHNLNPTLLSIGPLQIRYYGLVYALTLIITYFFLKKKADETGIKDVDTFLLYFVSGLIIGARLLHFLPNLSILIQQPLELFKIWHGGMSFFGGLIGSITATLLYCKKYKKSFWKITDIIVFPITIGLILGRIANFINAELIGKITSLPWCVVFPYYDGCRHPYQLYAALSHILLLGIIYLIYKLKTSKQLKPGIIFLSFMFFYSLIRFLTDFTREDPLFLGFTIWQYVSIIAMIVSSAIYKKRYKKLINKS